MLRNLQSSPWRSWKNAAFFCLFFYLAILKNHIVTYRLFLIITNQFERNAVRLRLSGLWKTGIPVIWHKTGRNGLVFSYYRFRSHRYTGFLGTWRLWRVWGFWGRWLQKSYQFLSIWSGLAATGHTYCSFSQNIEKPHQKFQKLSPTIFNLKIDFVIASCAFEWWNAFSAVVELRRTTGSELVAAYW